MDEFTRKAIDIRIEKTFNKEEYFNISAVCDMWEASGRSGYWHESWQRDRLNILHCVHWEYIDEEMKAEIKRVIETILEPDPDPQPMPPPWYKRIFKGDL